MSGGGQSTNTVQSADPWSGAQPYLTDAMQQASVLNQQGGPQQWSGATQVAQTAAQTGAQQQQQNYANNVYGGLSDLSGQNASGALNQSLTGSGSLSALTSGQGGAASGALGSMLSGTPDYSAVKGATDAANQQVWDNFNQTVLPGLNQKASFLNNPTGSIKDLNYAIPQITKQMDANTQQAYLSEYNRAKDAQSTGVGLYGQSATTQGSQSLQAASLYPTLAQAGTTPGQLSGSIADTGQQYQQSTLNDQINQYNYAQQQPYQNVNWYNTIAGGQGGLGHTSSSATNTQGSKVGSAIGGGMAGYALGSAAGGAAGALSGAAGGAEAGTSFGPWGAAIGALAGYLMG